MSTHEWRMQAAYGAAGAVVEQALRSICAVAAFGGEAAEAQRYSGQLASVERLGVRHGLNFGLGLGVATVRLICLLV